MKIENLNLSVRARNALMRAGVRTMEQLMSMDADDLLRIRNLGQKTVAEILTVIKTQEEKALKEKQKIAPRGSYMHGYQEGSEAMRRAAIRELTKRGRHMAPEVQTFLCTVCDVIKEIEVL